MSANLASEKATSSSATHFSSPSLAAAIPCRAVRAFWYWSRARSRLPVLYSRSPSLFCVTVRAFSTCTQIHLPLDPLFLQWQPQSEWCLMICHKAKDSLFHRIESGLCRIIAVVAFFSNLKAWKRILSTIRQISSIGYPTLQALCLP